MGYIADQPLTKGHPFRQRLGAFSISMMQVQQDPDLVLEVLRGCVVVRAELMFHSMDIEYVAASDQFDPIELGDTPLRYLVHITRHEDGAVTRTFKKA